MDMYSSIWLPSLQISYDQFTLRTMSTAPQRRYIIHLRRATRLVHRVESKHHSHLYNTVIPLACMLPVFICCTWTRSICVYILKRILVYSHYSRLRAFTIRVRQGSSIYDSSTTQSSLFVAVHRFSEMRSL